MINKEPASTHKLKMLFYVQHLLGIRHLKRAATLSRVMEAAGLAVTIVSGGKTLPEVNIGSAQLVQLPPMRPKDEYFSMMLDDPDLVPFDKTFPLASRMADRLSYTSCIVDPPPNHNDADGLRLTKSSCRQAAAALVNPYSARQSTPAHIQCLQRMSGDFWLVHHRRQPPITGSNP